MNKCNECGGDMVGNGYTPVMYCEYAEKSTYEHVEADSGPIYCDLNKPTTLKEEVLSIAKGLRNNSLALDCKRVGLCSNIQHYVISNDIEDLDAVLEPMFLSWKDFSGDIAYPVPPTNFDDPCDQYTKTKDLYAGEQGDYRIDLLDHIINELEKELGGG